MRKYTYIGPNVCIVEDVISGCNATKRTGTVVIKDIPNSATVYGNYAKAINYNNPDRYAQNNRLADCD